MDLRHCFIYIYYKFIKEGVGGGEAGLALRDLAWLGLAWPCLAWPPRKIDVFRKTHGFLIDCKHCFLNFLNNLLHFHTLPHHILFKTKKKHEIIYVSI